MNWQNSSHFVVFYRLMSRAEKGLTSSEDLFTRDRGLRTVQKDNEKSAPSSSTASRKSIDGVFVQQNSDLYKSVFCLLSVIKCFKASFKD